MALECTLRSLGNDGYNRWTLRGLPYPTPEFIVSLSQKNCRITLVKCVYIYMFTSLHYIFRIEQIVSYLVCCPEEEWGVRVEEGCRKTPWDSWLSMLVTIQVIHIYKKAKHISSEIKLCVIKWNDIGKKYWTHEEREVQKGMESQDTSWNL